MLIIKNVQTEISNKEIEKVLFLVILVSGKVGYFKFAWGK